MARSVNTQIIHQLRAKIVSGGFDQVTFLPSERKLADEYQVGRGIIRGALKVLKDEGLLYNVPKRGLRIKESREKRLKRMILRLPVAMSAKAYETIGIVSGVCAGANEIFAEVILSTPPAELDLNELKERYNSGEIQGIIFVENSFNLPIPDIIAAGIPCVVANIEEDCTFPGVRMDYREIGRKAGRELLNRGYKKIAVYTGNPEQFIYREIVSGFRGALAEENIFPDESMIIVGEREKVPPALARIITLPPEHRPEAVFTVRDYRAAHVYRICGENGIDIPGAMGVISYDNISWPGGENARLTTITEEVNELGRQAVRFLQRQYEAGYTPVTGTISGKLICRGSLKEKKNDENIIMKLTE